MPENPPFRRGEAGPSYKWSPPAVEPPAGAAAEPAAAPEGSHRAHWGVLEYVVSFVFYMLFFGLIAGLSGSRFPLELGLFLFFTNDELIERVLRSVGIRLVPDSLGASFVPAFAWLTGASILLVRWQHAAPVWLLPWLPPEASWPVVAGLAFGCAVLTVLSTTVVRHVLPWFGIEIRPQSLAWTLTHGLVGLVVLSIVLLLVWLESH